jgi:hypothetical protein
MKCPLAVRNDGVFGSSSIGVVDSHDETASMHMDGGAHQFHAMDYLFMRICNAEEKKMRQN